MFGDFPITELFYETPFQLLIAVMMSAQTTDKQVNKVTEILFKKIKNPADVLEMWWEELGKQISSIGLWRGKAKNILMTAELLVEKMGLFYEDSLSSVKNEIHIVQKSEKNSSRVYKDSEEIVKHHGYYIPDTIEEMLKLPGVWIKTAKVVLYVLYKQRRVAVDTHVHRVMNRLWIVSTQYPEKTSEQLEKIIPDTYKDVAHHVIIYFWRYLCKAKNPECERCPLKKECVWIKKNSEKK